MSHASRTAPDQGSAPVAGDGDRPQTSPLERPTQPVIPEIGGPKGPEPTRYGDWEQGGRCTDF
jgi:hypothetical protein